MPGANRQMTRYIQSFCIQSFLTRIYFHNVRFHQWVVILQTGTSLLSSTTTGAHITELGCSCLRKRKASCFGGNPACMKNCSVKLTHLELELRVVGVENVCFMSWAITEAIQQRGSQFFMFKCTHRSIAISLCIYTLTLKLRKKIKFILIHKNTEWVQYAHYRQENHYIVQQPT